MRGLKFVEFSAIVPQIGVANIMHAEKGDAENIEYLFGKVAGLALLSLVQITVVVLITWETEYCNQMNLC